MREEVDAAVGFLIKFMKKKLSKDCLDQFKCTLKRKLQNHYEHHWFPDTPDRGSGYRCIRINNQVMDPLLHSAAEESGIVNFVSLKLFPDELTMWIDPTDVSYRIGENGSIGQLDIESQHLINTLKPYTDTTTNSPYLIKAHSSCKDQVRESGYSSMTSRFGIGYPSMPMPYAAFAS